MLKYFIARLKENSLNDILDDLSWKNPLQNEAPSYCFSISDVTKGA